MTPPRRSRLRSAGLVLAVTLLLGGCAPTLKEVKHSLDDEATVGIAYRPQSIAVLDTTFEGRFGLRPDMPVPEPYQIVARTVRDAFRTHAPEARIDLIDPDSPAARAAVDVFVRVTVDGAYFCDGGLVRQQTCTLEMRAVLVIEDRRSGTVTALDYDTARRSAGIPGSEAWAAITAEQARRAVPPASLASILADEVRRDLDDLLSAPTG